MFIEGSGEGETGLSKVPGAAKELKTGERMFLNLSASLELK